MIAYKVLITGYPSDLEEQLNNEAENGFRLKGITVYGGHQVVAIMEKEEEIEVSVKLRSATATTPVRE